MEFKIEKSILSESLTSLNNYVEKRDIKAATANIMVKIEDSLLTMYATDYEYGLKLEITNIFDYTDGEFLVNSGNFLNTIKRLKNGEIHISLKGSNVTIKQNKSKLNLEVLETETFPKFSINEDKMSKLEFNSNEVLKGIKDTLFSIDSNNPKFELQCMLFDFKQTGLNIVTTDTRTLSLYQSNIKIDKEIQLLVPRKAILEIQKLLNDKCSIFVDDTNMLIKTNDFTFHTKLINGKFPDYTRVIPNEYKYTFEVPTNEFIESLKLVTALETTVQITFKNNAILIESATDKNKSETEITTNYETEEVIFKANSINLINALNNVDNDTFELCINSSRLPIVINSDNYKVINMPIIDND